MRSLTCSFLLLFSILIFLGQRRKKKLNLLIHSIFNGIQDGISILDPELNIIQVNQWMENMYKSELPLVGQKCYSVYQKRQEPCPWCPSIKTFETGEMSAETVPYPSEFDIRGWIYVSAYPIKDAFNNVINVIEHVKDITALKETENNYKEAFTRAEFYKDLFAHDINNILQNILSSAELCKFFSNKKASENKLEELLLTIENQVKRGTKLVSNVRKLSKIGEKEKIFIQEFDLYEVVQKVIKSLENSFPSKEIVFQFETQTNKQFVKANELIYDVFENLFNNAVKHNDNAVIELIIKTSQTKKNNKPYVKVEVIDNGMGIEDLRKDTIFKRVYMEGRSVSGMGLGLSLVKRIIESYNGYIWVEDRVQGDYTKGSNFVILFPNDK